MPAHIEFTASRGAEYANCFSIPPMPRISFPFTLQKNNPPSARFEMECRRRKSTLLKEVSKRYLVSMVLSGLDEILVGNFRQLIESSNDKTSEDVLHRAKSGSLKERDTVFTISIPFGTESEERCQNEHVSCSSEQKKSKLVSTKEIFYMLLVRCITAHD